MAHREDGDEEELFVNRSLKETNSSLNVAKGRKEDRCTSHALTGAGKGRGGQSTFPCCKKS